MRYVKLGYGALSGYFKLIGKTKCPFSGKCKNLGIGRCVGKGLQFKVLPVLGQSHTYYAPVCWVKGDTFIKVVTETEVAVSLL